MELRFRGKKAADDAEAIVFWLCEGTKKRRVLGRKSQSLVAAAEEWGMQDVLDNADLHFMNEASGLVVPRDEAMGKFIEERDVVRVCSTEELGALLEKFACRDHDVDAEMISPQKSGTSISSAISKLKTKARKLQKNFDERASPVTGEADLLALFPEIDPIFESDEIEEIPEGTDEQAKTCDVCDVSWPDGATMYRLKKANLVVHQGCAQFAADVLEQHPDVTSREQLRSLSSGSEVNKPGTFHVTVHRAMELPGAQLVGTQAPYCKLSMLPWKEPMQTKAAENGGHNPMWKSTHDNVMQFSHMYNSAITPIPLLEVEVWNANYISDDLIACTLLDMTPVLRYPNIEVKRWFTLSSRAQGSLAKATQRTGQPKVLLSIKFVPVEGKVNVGNEHKFRVHQLKSIGLAIPNCAVCDRSIMGALKGVWGYRCELCGIDVHKGCIMKAMAKCQCKTDDELVVDEESPDISGKSVVERRGQQYRVLTDGATRRVGELFVNFRGVHLCTKHCRREKNFHAKNVFEGDTYCRLSFDGIVHETSPVLKSADPMFLEKVCFKVRRPNSVFRIEVVDFNTDLAIAELEVTLFQLLQRAADRFIRTNELLRTLQLPLRHLSLNNESNQEAINDSFNAIPILSDKEHYELTSPTSSKTSKSKIGFALMECEYSEKKEDLLRVRMGHDFSLLEREEKEFSVESLRVTFDRFSRALKTFQGIDAQYASVISWKNKKKSTVCLLLFVYACVFVDLEYMIAYILGGVLVFMLYKLHLRIEGAFMKRWIGYVEYEREQEDKLKLYRPLADLHVAIHEARLSEETDSLLVESQSRLKDVSSSKLGFYVRIKYLPNDSKRPHSRGDMVLNPSGYDEAVVAWTNAVGKSRAPVWRNTSLLGSVSGSSSSLLFSAKNRKEFPFRNFNVSWRHNPEVCACKQCVAFKEAQEASSSSATQGAEASGTAATCGIDHHTYYFPVPQTSRKNFTGRDDLVPWRSFPGLLQFELCISLNGDAKETPDLIVATGTIPLRNLVKRSQHSSEEVLVPLSSFSTGANATATVDNSVGFPPESGLPASQELEKANGDVLLVRVGFETPKSGSFKAGDHAITSVTEEKRQQRMAFAGSNPVTHVERQFSEFVCESLATKEDAKAIGGHFLDAFWKVKDTIKELQNEIGRACGTIACAENLLNWTHPWKTATAFAVVAFLAVVFSIIRGRWVILLFGLSEFGAVFVEDAPPSKRARKILWNYLSSIPTDQDLIEVYKPEREVYTKGRKALKEREEAKSSRLRHHALWTGTVSSKAEGDRSYKSYFMVYRSYRFLLWKHEEDAETDSQPYLQLVFETPQAVADKTDGKTVAFSISGVSNDGSEETRMFSFDSPEKKEELLDIVRRSCEV